MADLQPGTARMTHPDPDLDDAVVGASQVPHFEHAGWRYVEGDREHWPEELQRFEGEAQVYIRHPVTGATAFLPASAVPHWRSVGWEVVDPDAEQEAALDDKNLAELKDEAKTRGLPSSGTKDELRERIADYDAQQQTEAGDQPAPSEEEEV